MDAYCCIYKYVYLALYYSRHHHIFNDSQKEEDMTSRMSVGLRLVFVLIGILFLSFGLPTIVAQSPGSISIVSVFVVTVGLVSCAIGFIGRYANEDSIIVRKKERK